MAEIAGLTSLSTSPEQPGASPDTVSVAPSPDHAGGAEIVQSPVQAQGGLAVGGDGIGDSDFADATTDPDAQSAPEDFDSDEQSSEDSVVTFPNKAGGHVGGASRSSRARSGRRGQVSGGDNSDIMAMLAEQLGMVTKVICRQEDERKESAKPAGGGVGRPGVGVDASSVLALPAVRVLDLCQTPLTTVEKQALDSTVRGWIDKTTAAVHTSVDVFETTVKALLSRFGVVEGGRRYATIARVCFNLLEPNGGGDVVTAVNERRQLCDALDSITLSPSQQLMVEQTAVAADRALRTRQFQAGILVASDTHMKALDGAALRYLSTVLDVHGMEIISGSTTFLGALCRLHTEAGACRSQAGAVAIQRLVDKTPIPVPAGGITLTRMIGDLHRNMGDRLQQIGEMGLTLFNVATIGALAVMPTGAGGAAEQMTVDVRKVMLVCSEDKNATAEMMQKGLQEVAEKWQTMAQVKLHYKEARQLVVAGAAPAMLAGGAAGSSKWTSPAAKAGHLHRGAPTAEKGGAATAVVPPGPRNWNRQGAGGDGRQAQRVQQPRSGGDDRVQRGGGQQQPPPSRFQPAASEAREQRECTYFSTGRVCPFATAPGGCKFSHGNDGRRNVHRSPPVRQPQRGSDRSVAFAGYAGETQRQHVEASAYRDAVVGDSTRAASPVQQLVQALEPTPLEAAEMQARSAALRKDKSQGVFLADVEERVRVAYDPAAAHDLASGDIELRQTGMSTFDFVGISGERIPGGIVGSTTVVTGVEEDLGRPVVLPVPEAHTMDTLPKRTLLLSGNRLYDDKYTVVICGETKQCKMWLPREPDGSRAVVDLEFGADDRVLQLAEKPKDVVPGLLAPGEWSGPTEVGISQRKGDAGPLRLASLHTGNIFMALAKEKKKQSAAKPEASVAAAAAVAPMAVPPTKLDPGRYLRLGGQPVVKSVVKEPVTVSALTAAVAKPVASAPVLSSLKVAVPEPPALVPAAPVVEPAASDVVGPPLGADGPAILAACPLCGMHGDPGAVAIHANSCLDRQERGDDTRLRGEDGGAFDVSMSDPDSNSDAECSYCSSGVDCRRHQPRARPSVLGTVGALSQAQWALLQRQRQCGACACRGDVNDMVRCIGPVHLGSGAMPCREAVHMSCHQPGSQMTPNGWLCRHCTTSCVTEAVSRQMAAIGIGGDASAGGLGPYSRGRSDDRDVRNADSRVGVGSAVGALTPRCSQFAGRRARDDEYDGSGGGSSGSGRRGRSMYLGSGLTRQENYSRGVTKRQRQEDGGRRRPVLEVGSDSAVLVPVTPQITVPAVVPAAAVSVVVSAGGGLECIVVLLSRSSMGLGHRRLHAWHLATVALVSKKLHRLLSSEGGQQPWCQCVQYLNAMARVPRGLPYVADAPMQVAFLESFGWHEGQFYYSPKRRQQIRDFYESVNPALEVRFTAAGDICVDTRNGEDFGLLMARQFRESQKKFLVELGEEVVLTSGVCFQCKSASRFDMLECQEAGCAVKVHRLCLTHGEGKWWCPHHVAQVNCGRDADELQQWRCGRHRQSEAALDSRVRESVDVYATSWQKQAYLDDDSDDDLPGLVSSSESSEAESDDDTEYRPVRTMRRSDRGVRRGDRRRNECRHCDANPCSEAQLPYEEAEAVWLAPRVLGPAVTGQACGGDIQPLGGVVDDIDHLRAWVFKQAFLSNPVKTYLTLVAAGAGCGDLDSPAVDLRRFGLSVSTSNEIVSARARERRLMRDLRKYDLAQDAEAAGMGRAERLLQPELCRGVSFAVAASTCREACGSVPVQPQAALCFMAVTAEARADEVGVRRHAVSAGADSDSVRNMRFISLPDGLLDDRLETLVEAIAHQVHCYAANYGGLARAVMDKFRYSEPSQPLHDTGRGQIFAPGTIQMRWASSGSSATRRRGEFRPAVALLFGQLVPGSYGAAGDSYHDRLRYMEQCLNSLSKVSPRLRSVAFPHNMGCGIACGAWSDYHRILCAWARKNPDIHVYVVRWDREAVQSGSVAARVEFSGSRGAGSRDAPEGDCDGNSRRQVCGEQSSRSNGSGRHTSGSAGANGVAQGGRGCQQEVLQVTPEVLSAPVVLPFVDGVASLPEALGFRDYSGPPREAGRHYLSRYKQPVTRSKDPRFVVYDFGAGSFSSGVAVSHCPDACYVACDLYDPADRVVTDMLRVRNADGVRAAYIQGRPAAAPTLNELARVMWETWRLPVSALRVVLGSPNCGTVSSAPQGQQYRARRNDGNWTATSRRAKDDDAARVQLMDMAEDAARRVHATAIIEQPRTGIAAQVQDVNERLLFLRGGAWRVHYSDHCQWSSVEWSQKMSQLFVLGDFIPMEVRCGPLTRCQWMLPGTSVHSLGIVDYNYCRQQRRVADGDVRRAALPVELYSALIALALEGQDRRALGGVGPSAGSLCGQRAGQQSGFHGTVMHHTSTPVPQSGSGAVLLDSNAVSPEFSGELRRSQRRNQRRAAGNDGSSTAPRLNPVRPVPNIEGQAPAAEVFAAVGNGKLPVLRDLPMTAMQLHRACLHADAEHILASARRWPGFRLRMADGQIIPAGELRLSHLRITNPCDTCMLCRTNAPPSRHTAHQAAAKVAAVKSDVTARPASAAGSTAHSPRRSGRVAMAQQPVMHEAYLSMLQHGVVDARGLRHVSCVQEASVFLAELDEPEEYHGDENSSSSSESDSAPVPAADPNPAAAFGSDPVEPEAPVDKAVVFPKLPWQVFVKPHATGRDQPTFAMLDAMSAEDGRNRLVFCDYVYPYNKNLKADYKAFLVVMDYKTRYAQVQPLRSKEQTMEAFGVVAMRSGWHKLPHSVQVVSDGEPKLVQQISAACQRLGLMHSTSVPNRPNTNPAGSNLVRSLRRLVDCALVDGSRWGSVINGTFEAIAWEFAVHTHNALANRSDPLNRSPHELNFGVPPTFQQCAFGTPGYMHLTSNGRRAHIARCGLAGAHRAERVLYIGERDGHHRGLTERGTSRCGPMFVDLDGILGVFPETVPVEQPVLARGLGSESDGSSGPVSAVPSGAAVRQATGVLLTSADGSLRVVAGKKSSSKDYIKHRCQAVLGLTVEQALQQSFPNAAGAMTRFRRSDLDYDIKCGRLQIEVIESQQAGGVSVQDAECLHNAAMMMLAEAEPSEVYNMTAAERAEYYAFLSGVVAQKGLSWKRFLEPTSEHRQDAINAYNKELQSIISMGVMDELQPGTARYAEALTSEATTLCRVLLDRKRDGTLKARIVVRGDLENTLLTDGEGFNTYAGTAASASVRLALLQSGRNVLSAGETSAEKLVVSTDDITSAFCQSNRFNDGIARFLKLNSPLDGVWRYFDQHKPLYGACSAPVRWQDTFAEWITSSASAGGPGFVRSMNAGSIYYQPPRPERKELLLVLYVDDIMLIGRKSDQLSFYAQLNARFQCKPVQWLEPGKPIDYLGLTIHEDAEYTWICMEAYIKNMCVILNMENCVPMAVPFSGSMTDQRELCADRKVWFATALGMVLWLNKCARPDIGYAASRIAQHAAAPTNGAYEALVKLVRYCASTPKLAIRQNLNVHVGWQLFSDSDMAGNAEPGNKRRSQLGYVAMLGSAPITWSSKVSSVQFGPAALPAGFLSEHPPVTAHRDIKGEHVATSSAEAETYACALFANEVLALSYIAEEAGLPFPKPAVIQVDNMAAIAFSKQAQFSGRSKLRHVDCRQQWLQVLRDSNIVKCVHVSSEFNKADIFTKALDTDTFVRLRDTMLFHCPH